MVQSSCSVKNGKLNETIEVSALWSIRRYEQLKDRQGVSSRCSAGQCIQPYIFTIMMIIMVYYTYLESPYFSLFNDMCFILIGRKLLDL